MKLPVLIWCAAACCLSAQEPAAVDLEARRQSVVTLKQHLEMRQKRLEEVAAEIRDRGQKMDQKIEELVKLLAGLKDSQDSKRRVSAIKADAIVGLKRMIETYKTERRGIVERLRADGSAPADALNKDMDVIDKLVEKRAADIVELVKSLPAGEDIAKYEAAGGTYYDGFYEEETRVSEAWKQNRRDKVESGKIRREVQQALEKAIADLDSRQDSIAAALRSGDLSEPAMEIQSQELSRVSALLVQRRAQLMDVMLAGEAPAESASKNEADDLKGMLNDARRDIAADFAKTLRLYRSAAGERDKIFAIERNLEAREKWLSENDPAAKKGE